MRSFVKDTAAATSSPAVTETQESAPAHTRAVLAMPSAETAVARPQAASRFIDGEIDKSDIKTPYLSCVQAVGPKSMLYTPGTLVLGESAITAAPAPPAPGQPLAGTSTGKIRVLFLRVSKTFVENLPYNAAPGAPRARIFRNLDEVRAAGLRTEWIGNQAPGAMPKTACFTLIRQPATLDDGQFNIIADDKTYAPAMVTFQKTSYGAAKTLYTDLSLSLKGDPTKTFYDLFWVREQRGQNFVWVAKLVRVRDEVPSEAVAAIALKLSGGSLSFDDAAEDLD